MVVATIDQPRVRKNGWYGCKASIASPKDKWFKKRAVRLPQSADLTMYAPPIMNQGNLGSCVANGVTAAMRSLMIKKGAPAPMLSRLQLYYDGRVVEDCVGEDTGLEIRDAMRCSMKIGVAREELWPYDVTRFMDQPPQEVYQDAEKWQVLKFERVEVSNSDVKHALARGFPVIIGITLFDSFESDEVEKTGMVPMPVLSTEKIVGGHCMVVYNYGVTRGRYKTLNWWDSDWGDRGWGYLPEEMVGSPDYGSDYWIVTDVEMVESK